MRRHLVYAFVLLSLFGCKKKRAQNLGEATSFVSALNKTFCEYEACQTGLSPAASKATCAKTSQNETDSIAIITSGIVGDRVVYDLAAGQACLDALAPFSVDSCWGPTATRTSIGDVFDRYCTHVFSGTVAPGDSCYGPYECAGGSCDASLDSCPGRCSKARPEGTECQATEQCASDLLCYSSFGASRCARPVGAGDDCLNAPCAKGLRCNGSHICGTVTTAGTGTACSPGSDCGDGLYCAYATNGYACAPLVPAGGTCTSDSACAGRQRCAQDGMGQSHCVVPSDLGGPCNGPNGSPSADSAVCFQNLTCDPMTNKCTAPPAIGSPCPDYQCADNAFCLESMTTLTCAAKKKQGETCTAMDQCQGYCSGFSGGLCVDDVPISTACVGP